MDSGRCTFLTGVTVLIFDFNLFLDISLVMRGQLYFEMTGGSGCFLCKIMSPPGTNCIGSMCL
jgi:hypothetical protein